MGDFGIAWTDGNATDVKRYQSLLELQQLGGCWVSRAIEKVR